MEDIESGYGIAAIVNNNGKRTHIISWYLRNRAQGNTMKEIANHIKNTSQEDAS
jgi:hypothetical protein